MMYFQRLFLKGLSHNACLGLNKIDRLAYLTPDGIAVSDTVNSLGNRKLNAKVVDTVLNGRTYASRILGMGKPMMGKTFDYTVKIVDSGSGQFFTGLEQLNVAATNTKITLSYAHTAFSQPAVSVMLDAFANAGPEGIIDYDMQTLSESIAEAIQGWGHAIYGLGTASQPNGLGNVVDNGSTVDLIGGQSRGTYSLLKAQVSAFSGGQLSLANLGALEDTTVAAGIESEEPNVNVTTKPIWTNFESLLTPTMRADYQSSGYNAMALRGNDMLRNRAELKGAAGFTVLGYRGKPVLKDDDATAQTWFMLNERYFEFRGRTTIPTKYVGKVQKVSLSEASKTMDGVAGSPDYAPPSSVGWFYQPYQSLPTQAGQVGRYYCIGQVTASQLRRQGKGTGITTV